MPGSSLTRPVSGGGLQDLWDRHPDGGTGAARAAVAWSTVPQVRPLQIGEVAERTGLSLHTLRHYDEVGLVVPSSRSEGGFRLYAPADVERLLLIRRMKPLGYALEEMRELLAAVDAAGGPGDGAAADQERLRAALAGFVASAQERRAKLAAQLAMADEFIGLLQERSGP